MTFSRRLSSLAVVVLLAGLTLSACGDKDSTSDSSGSKPAADTLTKANFTQTLTDAQIEAKSAHIDMTVGMAGQSIKAQGDMATGASAADSAVAMTMDMGSSMKFEMRLVDRVFYMNMGQMTDNKFVKVDLTDESNPFAKQYGHLLDQMDPSRQLGQLNDAITKLEKKGKQKIDGVETQAYAATIDTAKVSKLMDLDNAGQLPATLDYMFYIGPDNLPRRMEYDMNGVKATMNFTKWGEEVAIKAPAASQISDRDFAELFDGTSNS